VAEGHAQTLLFPKAAEHLDKKATAPNAQFCACCTTTA
jgi:hypothetical protein